MYLGTSLSEKVIETDDTVIIFSTVFILEEQLEHCEIFLLQPKTFVGRCSYFCWFPTIYKRKLSKHLTKLLFYLILFVEIESPERTTFIRMEM